MNKFKKGDKVRLIKGGNIGSESTPWWKYSGLMIGNEYIVEYTRNDGIKVETYPFIHHINHFELIKSCKEYVVKLTQNEVDALIDVAGVVSGDPVYSMRRYTDHIWEQMYEENEICSVSPFDTDTTGNFIFEDLKS